MWISATAEQSSSTDQVVLDGDLAEEAAARHERAHVVAAVQNCKLEAEHGGATQMSQEGSEAKGTP
jgi:hypothetical protein